MTFHGEVSYLARNTGYGGTLMRLLHLTLIGAVLSLSACSGGLVLLRKPGDGPDEFRIVPGKPLEEPESFSALPAPTPGGVNRTDLRPLDESVAALGGTRSPEVAGSVPAGDAAIVRYSSRLGRDGTIRQTLATEDEAFRKRWGRLTKLKIAPRDDYAVIYQRQTLDPQAENRRWRRAGAVTPSAPPQ